MSLYRHRSRSGSYNPGFGIRPTLGISMQLIALGFDAPATEPCPKTPRRGPTQLEWKCPCGRLHKKSADRCAVCEALRPVVAAS